MNKYITLILTLNLLFSCKGKTEDIPVPTEFSELIEWGIESPADSLFVFYKNCKISTDKIKKRELGNNLVFQYYLKETDYIDTTDEEYFEEIKFEIPIKSGLQKYSTNNLSDYKTTFEWGCFCDWPNETEAEQNIGKIELEKLNDSIWEVTIDIKNIPLNKEKKIKRKFYEYKPKLEIATKDTINRTDKFNRKQGHWITESYFTIENGIYSNNYFSGSRFNFMYYKEKKTLSSIWIYENDEWTKSIKFDRYGKLVKK
ncbi:hypothetical protein HSX10_17605 [Winogradskyella undariae]|uniref:hypothetical protein n=1 Tax=Winogradskyella undariae TaxID=1285465 RepID=UPI00156B660D|nr:hypothetical protein [Winogradskyella undariae]NRR93394.1 hypothetical protein [Winogradskyella undariae]